MDGSPNLLVPLIFVAWFPITAALFVFLPARRAVIVSLLAGWLLLPVMEYEIKLIPEFNKTAVIGLSMLCGVLLFDGKNLAALRFRWFDWPVVLLCCSPFFSSVANELGLYDGISESFRQVLRWGVPYLIGRLYFTDLAGMRDLAVGMFIAGLVYVPLCLYEVRMSPQLNVIVYGYHQHSFLQHMRFGGWRPMVFMDHGLMVGTFMAGASLCGLWLYTSRGVRDICGIPMGLLVCALLVATLLVKSVGAIVLLAAGVAAFSGASRTRTRVPLVVLVLIPIVYIGARATGSWSADLLVDTARHAVGEERAASLEFRLANEKALAKRALERPYFGWGGWGRARIYDEYGRDVSTTDSLWVIALGNNGVVGLGALLMTFILPVMMSLKRLPVALWMHPRAGAVAALAVIMAMWLNDSLLNAMISPLYPLLAGALAGTPRVAVLCSNQDCHSPKLPRYARLQTTGSQVSSL